MTSAALAEVAMGDAVQRQGSTDPGQQPPGSVLVVAIDRHKADGVVRLPGQQYYLEASRVDAGTARGLIHPVGSIAVDWWKAPGRVLSPWDEPESVYTRDATPGALKIVQGCGYDPGSSAFRFHSALAGTKHASAFVRFGDSNPYCSLRQYDGDKHSPGVRQAILEADVIHCHMNYILLNNSGLQKESHQILVRHYHGSKRVGGAIAEHEWDHLRGAHVVAARLSLAEEIREGNAEHKIAAAVDWLPITVPVTRYRALVSRPDDGVFRIAHAPTKRAYKATEEFVRAVRACKAKGLRVEAVLIENALIRDALERKARCDATFDSFWLGIQTSGLEGAAMGQPVIAGDPYVRGLHEREFGHCPYTYANDEKSLTHTIERLVVDEEWRRTESARVSAFVLAHHDYPAVARRYEQLLARWTGRADVLTEAKEPKPKPSKRRKVA